MINNIAQMSDIVNEMTIFDSSNLEHHDSISISVTLEIQQVNGDGDPNNWIKYGICDE